MTEQTSADERQPAEPDAPTQGAPVGRAEGSSAAEPERTLAFGDALASRLVEVLDGYLEQLKAGQAPPRDQLLAAHPELAGELEKCLAGLEFIHRSGTPATPPDQLGDFRIVREVGRGGMGAVYEAEQVSLGRRVALKVLRFGTVSDPEAVQRFQREAETVANLHHTNIVPIFYHGNQGGVNYYAMQFIEGRSLADVLAESAPPKGAAPADPQTVARWGLQAAEALAHAHARGVVHRDVKPSNLLLDEEGQLWLSDFGLARRLDDVTLSVTGALLGTPRYMSPEQASAAHRRVDHRTDIYSLGATLYELATGKPVFSATTAHGVIHEILSSEPEPPRKIRPEIPRDLETILMKCLAKEAGERYASAVDLAADLRAFLEDRPIRARRAGPLEVAARWVRRRKRSVALGAAAVAGTLLLLAAGAAAWYGYTRSQAAELMIDVDAPPMVARLLDEQGQPAREAETLPTQHPLELPGGEYRLRLEGESRLSQTYTLHVPRGEQTKLQLSLDDQLVGPSMRIDRRFAEVEFADGADLLFLEQEGLVRRDPLGGSDLWSLTAPALVEKTRQQAPGLVWPWFMVLGYVGQRSGFGEFDIAPYVLSPAVDLNRDGEGDLVLAARHQSWVLALSGANGSPLWIAARGKDVTDAPDQGRERSNDGVRGAVLGPPAVIQDLNGDGAPELVATFVDVGTFSAQAATGTVKPRRWVEALSGATGESLWRYDLEDALFALPAAPAGGAAEAPYPFRWFWGTNPGEASAGPGSLLGSGRPAVRFFWPNVQRTGDYVYVPSAARPLPGETPHVALVAGTQLIVLDARTGAAKTQDTGIRPALEPVWADLDGDGAEDVVLAEELPPGGGPGRGAPRLRLGAWSPAHGKLLWQRTVAARRPTRVAWAVGVPRWPRAVDLDGDGACELILPDGTSDKGQPAYPELPWGELTVLDGASGQPRWPQPARCYTINQQIDRFAAGPDIDGDGCREVYAATLFSKAGDLYIDCLSGRTGARLWLARWPGSSAPHPPWVGPLRWWQAGEDGWPQLIVPLHPGTFNAERDVAHVLFSAGTGAATHDISGPGALQPADVDADGVQELLAFTGKGKTRDFGGTLEVFRSAAAEPWRRLAEAWQPCDDLDGDGVRDLVDAGGRHLVRALSGRQGTLLWETTFDGVSNPQAVTAGHDLDGDGTRDVLLFGTDFTVRPVAPLAAVSGRSGRLLWQADGLQTRLVQDWVLLESRDLDGDGAAEVLLAAAMNLGAGAGDLMTWNDRQLWLAVLSGRDGSVRWKKPLTAAPNTPAGQFPYSLQRARFEPAYADLDGDGVTDLVLPGEAPGARPGGNMQLQAYSGRDGNVLWRYDLPPPTNARDALAEVPPAVAVDLDGDGADEFVTLAFTSAAGGGRTAEVRALDGRDGRPLWHWQTDVDPSCGDLNHGPQQAGNRPRPLPLRTASGRPAICLNLPGRPDRIVVLGHDGLVLAEQTINPNSYTINGFRVWPCDADGDGADEIAWFNDGNLVLSRPGETEPLWTCAADRFYSDVLAIEPRPGQAPLIVLQVSPGATWNRDLVGLDAADGKRLWICRGPLPRRRLKSGEDNAENFLQFKTVASLGPPNEDAPPLVFYHYGNVTLCRQAAAGGDPRAGVLRAAAVTAPVGDDPRLLRSMPDFRPGERRDFYYSLVWAAFYWLTLIAVPAVFIGWLVHRRRWGLRTMLLMPAVAAVVLLGLMVDGPTGQHGPVEFRSAANKLLAAGLGVPAFAFVAIVAWWLVRGRWRRALAWLAVSLAAAPLAAALAVRLDPTPQAPGEVYVLDWSVFYLAGEYVVGCLMLLVIPLWLGIGMLLRRLRGAPARSPAVE